MNHNSNGCKKSFGKKDVSHKDKQLYIKLLRSTVLKALGISYFELKKRYSQERIFQLALQHVTATKKAICVAFDLEVERQCRCKRKLERENRLVQTLKRRKCRFTDHPAHYLTTDASKFDKLLNDSEK